MKKRTILLMILILILIIHPFAPAEESDLPVIRISVEETGDIYVELYPDIAPITVENFLSLIDRQFYNGLTFHRIISGFMIQGGDPKGNGTGGSEQKITGEFSANGVENPLLHRRGILSMARSSDMNSASSQFFIVQADASHLDGKYAAFGKVLSGMNVVDALCRDIPVTDNNGTVSAADQPVIREIVRVSRSEAENAIIREEENGKKGVYRDDVLGFSFPVPDGWNLKRASGSSVIFASEDEESFIQVSVQDLWRRFGSDFRASMEAEGKTREHLDTGYFGDRLTRAVTGAEEMTFTESEYSGAVFYAGNKSDEGTKTHIFIGVNRGHLICFIGTGEHAGEALEQIMTHLILG